MMLTSDFSPALSAKQLARLQYKRHVYKHATKHLSEIGGVFSYFLCALDVSCSRRGCCERGTVK